MRKKTRLNLQRISYETVTALDQYFNRCDRTSIEVFSGVSRMENRTVIDSILKWCITNRYRWKSVHTKWAFIKAIIDALSMDTPIYIILGNGFLERVDVIHVIEIIKSIYEKKQRFHQKWRNEQWIYNFKNIHFITLYQTKKDELEATRYGQQLQIELDNLTSPVFRLMERLQKTEIAVEPSLDMILSRLDSLTNQITQN